MALRRINPGTPITLTQNEVYALPAKLCHLTSTIALDVSVDGVLFIAAPSSTTGNFFSVGFIRCTTGPAVVMCKVH